MEPIISKEEFSLFESIRKSGKYNMIMQAQKVIVLMDIEVRKYWFIIDNYGFIRRLCFDDINDSSINTC